MSDAAATKVANNFGTLIASYSSDFADQTLTTDFVDYSDSVIELINGACTDEQNIPVRPPFRFPGSPMPASAPHDCEHGRKEKLCNAMLTPNSLAARLCGLRLPRIVRIWPGCAAGHSLRDPEPVEQLQHRKHTLPTSHWHRRI
jgi:hypothetical protein